MTSIAQYDEQEESDDETPDGTRFHSIIFPCCQRQDWRTTVTGVHTACHPTRLHHSLPYLSLSITRIPMSRMVASTIIVTAFLCRPFCRGPCHGPFCRLYDCH